jgi:UrcA family protein
MNSLKNRSIAGTAALVATFITVAMSTPLRAEPVAIKVSYSDLNVHSEAGAAKLQSRIVRAAEKVCGYRDVAGQIANNNCRRKAVAAAQDQVSMVSESSGFRLAAR